MTARPVDKEQKRSDLLAAAARVFSAHGFKNTTMAEVAREADVGKGTLYEYFDSKDDLFLSLFEWFGRESLQAAAPASGDAVSFSESLKAFGRESVRVMLDNWELFPLTMEFWSEASQPGRREGLFKVMQGMYEGYRGVVAALLRAGQAAGEFRPELDADALAVMVVGAFDGMFLQYHFDPGLDPAAIVEQFLETFIAGIRATDHGGPT